MDNAEAALQLLNAIKRADIGTIRSEYRELVSDETHRAMEHALKAFETLELIRELAASGLFVNENLSALAMLRKLLER